jgi:hypothetical protein
MAAAEVVRAQARTDIPPFIAWLRQLRRSAWVLIALCSVFRVGDALLNDSELSPSGSVAIAAQIR